MKNKLINLNNSISNNVNANPNITNSSQNKATFSSSMKETNKEYNTLEDDNFSSTNVKNEFKGNKESVSAIKSNLSIIKNKIILDYSALSININSTWGNLTKCGLTEIQLVDEKNRKIEIKECHVFNGSENYISR